MLSNTATPIYYDRFRENVLAGRIPVCKELEMQMNRIDQRILDPRYYYDDQAINGYVDFCEGELCLTDGSPLVLLDSFKLWAEDALAWFYFIERDVYEPDPDGKGGHYVRRLIKRRLCHKQFLIVGRGNSKTLYASTHQMYGVAVDPETSEQVVTAPTMAQAEETLSPMRTAITRARGPLMRFMTMGSMQNTTGSKANRPHLASTKKGIENFLTNSICRVRSMSIDKLQGYHDKIAVS